MSDQGNVGHSATPGADTESVNQGKRRHWIGPPKPGIGTRLKINVIFWIGFVVVLVAGIRLTKDRTHIDPSKIVDVLKELINLWLCGAQLLGIFAVFVAVKGLRGGMKWLSRRRGFEAAEVEEQNVRETQRLFEEELLSVTINLASLFLVAAVVLLFDRDFSWPLLLAICGSIVNALASDIIFAVENAPPEDHYGFKKFVTVWRTRLRAKPRQSST